MAFPVFFSWTSSWAFTPSNPLVRQSLILGSAVWAADAVRSFKTGASAQTANMLGPNGWL